MTESAAERRWRALLASSLPREEGPQPGQGRLGVREVQAIVRDHIGARTCPRSFGRASLADAAVGLRLASESSVAWLRLTAPNVSAVDDDVLGKRTRPDRAEHVKRRSGVKQATVKCALLGRLNCGGDPGLALRVVAEVKKRVETYSRRVVDASLSYMGVVKRLFVRDGGGGGAASVGGHLWIADVAVPSEIFEQTFVRQLLLGVGGASKPSALVEQTHRDHPALFPSGNRHLGDRNVYSAGAIQYLVS